MNTATTNIPLARHIEALLLQHDCVVVPGFGGFITNYVEAQPEQQEATTVFYPPYRVVRFNQSLQQSDGLLVGSYMTAYDAAFPAAERQMQKDVDEMVGRLALTGRYELDHIGLLRMDLSHHITLESAESGLTTPSFYGLSTLEMASAEAVEAERKLKEAIELTTLVPVVTEPANEEEDNDTVTISIRRRWVDVAISAAAAVLLFFLFSYPMMNEPSADDVVVAGAQPTTVTKQNATQQAAQPAETPVATAHAEAEETAEVAEQPDVQPAQEQETATTEAAFSIVLASYVAEPNSLEYIEQLAKAGFKEGRFERTGKVNRVLYGRYASADAANKALKALKEQSGEFREAWVYDYQ
ncbi:MAG: SPOR domain-containing protein [Bacteroidaceae bacterium]|nr:SPOR domain-containing protein [Bacteroidaceae bacterium]